MEARKQRGSLGAPRHAGRTPSKPQLVSREAVTKLFTDNYKRGPIPTEMQADYFRNAIHAVLNQPVPQSNNSNEGFAERLALYKAMMKLVQAQKIALDPFPGMLRFPNLIAIERFEKQLEAARDVLLHPFDPEAGLRKGAEWHKQARYLAKWAEQALRNAGRKTVSINKNGPFVGLIRDALVLSGQPERGNEAVAAALALPSY
jgi:hypothetical protein